MIYADDLSVPEGPVVLPDGSWLVVEMGEDRGCVSHLTENGTKRTELARTGRPNGLAIDAQLNIWVAESNSPALLRMDLAGRVETIHTEFDGQPFLFPNDLCFGPDGKLYFTDSGIRFPEFAPGGRVVQNYGDLRYDGRVYRMDMATRKLELLAEGIKFTNGLAFDPDDRFLYVAETVTGNILRYGWSENGLAPAEVFGNVVAPNGTSGLKGPDGMAFDINGDLYVAVFAQGDVTVLAPDGTVKTRIETEGVAPVNLAFGLNGEAKIYVTEDQFGTIEVFDVPAGGLPLHNGALRVR